MDPNTNRLSMGAAGAGAATYVEDVFSTWLYTGNSSTQTITNGIDLSGKGGLVWIKSRSDANSHQLFDTVRGVAKPIYSNLTNGQGTNTDFATFNSTGFSLGFTSANGGINGDSTDTYASWTFRKTPGFFDVVTWTGDNVPNRAVPHSLGSTPGCIIVKQISSSGQNWHVWHRSMNPAWTGGTTAGVTTGGNITGAIYLNTTDAFNNGPGIFTYVNSTAFGVYYSNLELNTSGQTYVAYLFAHDAQLFGDGGNQSVVKCGVTSSISGYGTTTVDLGWEPQFLLVKPVDRSGNWIIADNMRGLYPSVSSPTGAPALSPNLSDAESTATDSLALNATGFTLKEYTGGTTAYIYIAIRRGPMKTPTDATKVFDDNIGLSTPGLVANTGFPVDLHIEAFKDGSTASGAKYWINRLTGPVALTSNSTNAESSAGRQFDNMSGVYFASTFNFSPAAIYDFRRAPGFFDAVCYTGTGSARTVTHNLGVAPELVIVKRRNSTAGWGIQPTVGPYGADTFMDFTTAAAANIPIFGAPTSTTISISSYNPSDTIVNASGSTYIAYLFATLTGISKVGNYTGTGTTQQINCGFTAGARFVLIKRTDSTGDWYVWDSARGIVSGNDPYLLLNSTAAEVTGTDYVDTFNAGFEISSTAPAAINANGGNFIFLAVA